MISIKHIFSSIIIGISCILLSCSGGNDDGSNAANDDVLITNIIMQYFMSGLYYQYPDILIYPHDGYTSVSSDTNIRIFFKGPVNQEAHSSVTVDSIVYTKNSSEATWELYSLPGYSYPELIIHPSEPLTRGKTIRVTAEGFTGENGEALEPAESVFTISGWYPYITVSPSRYSSNSPDSDVVVTFPETVNTASNWELELDGIHYDASSPEASWSGEDTILTINPVGFFKRESTVYLSGSGFTALYDEYPFPNIAYSFNIINRPGKTINPPDGAKAVHPDSTIAITFSEPVVTDGDWSITADGLVYDKSSPGISWSENTLTIAPAREFPVLSKVQVTLQGFRAVLDNAELAPPLAASFMTSFKISTIPTSEYLDEYSSSLTSVIDSSDTIHIAYTSSWTPNTWYATGNGSVWQSSLLAGNAGRSAIAVGPDNGISCIYSNHSSYPYALTHAALVGDTWQSEVIDPEYDSGCYPSFIIDINNKPHAAYWINGDFYDDYNYALKYATKENDAWTINTLETSNPQISDPMIAPDASGAVHMCYNSGVYLKYATNMSGSWQFTTIDSGATNSDYSSIAVDSSGAAHIGYIYDAWPDNYIVKYATNKGGSWIIRTIASAGFYGGQLSIAIDKNDHVYIAYFDVGSWGSRYLKLATNESGSWVTYYIDSSNDFFLNRCSLVLGSDGLIHVFYILNNALLHAVNMQ